MTINFDWLVDLYKREEQTRARNLASIYLLDRAFGKPVQNKAVDEFNEHNTIPNEMSSEQLSSAKDNVLEGFMKILADNKIEMPDLLSAIQLINRQRNDLLSLPASSDKEPLQ